MSSFGYLFKKKKKRNREERKEAARDCVEGGFEGLAGIGALLSNGWASGV